MFWKTMKPLFIDMGINNGKTLQVEGNLVTGVVLEKDVLENLAGLDL